MRDKTSEYTEEERKLLWDVVLGLRAERSLEGVYEPYTDLADTFRSCPLFKKATHLFQSSLPKSSWALLDLSLENMPLYVNYEDIITAAIARWRCSIAR